MKRRNKYLTGYLTNFIMFLHFIGIFIILACNVQGFPDTISKTCETTAVRNCSQYKICIEDTDRYIYPGRIKTLVHDLYIPHGLTENAFIHLVTPPDTSVMISDVYLDSHDDSLNMAKGIFKPTVIKRPRRGLARFPIEATYHFGNIDCKGTRKLLDITTELPITFEVPNSVTSNLTITVNSTFNSVPTVTSNVSTISSLLADSNNTTYFDNTTDLSTSTHVTTTSDEDAGDKCTFCLMKVAVEYLMANIDGISENSTRTVNATLSLEKASIAVSSVLVLRPVHKSTIKSNLSTDIPNIGGFSESSLKVFYLKTSFRNPLSTYKLVLRSPTKFLRIASISIQSVGEHYKDIIPTTSVDILPSDGFCGKGPDTRVIDFGYVPNKGFVDANTSSSTADNIDFKVILLLTNGVTLGETYPLDISLEVDFLSVAKTTKHFNATERIAVEGINATTSQTSQLLPKGGKCKVTLTWTVPPLTAGLFVLYYSTRRYDGPGGDGMVMAVVRTIDDIGGNIPCSSKLRESKKPVTMRMLLANIPINNEITSVDGKFGFGLWVIAQPDIVEANSSHELTIEFINPGKVSPQIFKIYFNVTDQEIFMTQPSLDLDMNILLHEKCRSITFTTDVVFILITERDRSYGRLSVELPTGSSFAMCSFELTKGYNIFGRFHENITRRSDGMIEKVLVDISPLSNVNLHDDSDKIKMDIRLTYIDNDINNIQTSSFKPRIISNNVSIWTEELTIPKPTIEYHPDFKVLKAIVKVADVDPQSIWYHYSLNGSYYHREALLWKNDSNVYMLESPKIIAYFYFSTTPCTVICNLKAVWDPLKHHITVMKDDNNRLLKMLPYALDQDLNTCFDLPVPGNSPPMLWMIIKDLILFNVTSRKFVVHVTGENIECARVGQKTLHVGTSVPSKNDKCSPESDIVFCRVLSQSFNSAVPQCDFECVCKDLQKCSNIHVLMQSANKDVWKLCELTITDVL